eukprot:gene17874-21313_t
MTQNYVDPSLGLAFAIGMSNKIEYSYDLVIFDMNKQSRSNVPIYRPNTLYVRGAYDTISQTYYILDQDLPYVMNKSMFTMNTMVYESSLYACFLYNSYIEVVSVNLATNTSTTLFKANTLQNPTATGWVHSTPSTLIDIGISKFTSRSLDTGETLRTFSMNGTWATGLLQVSGDYYTILTYQTDGAGIAVLDGSSGTVTPKYTFTLIEEPRLNSYIYVDPSRELAFITATDDVDNPFIILLDMNNQSSSRVSIFRHSYHYGPGAYDIMTQTYYVLGFKMVGSGNKLQWSMSYALYSLQTNSVTYQELPYVIDYSEWMNMNTMVYESTLYACFLYHSANTPISRTGGIPSGSFIFDPNGYITALVTGDSYKTPIILYTIDLDTFEITNNTLVNNDPNFSSNIPTELETKRIKVESERLEKALEKARKKDQKILEDKTAAAKKAADKE